MNYFYWGIIAGFLLFWQIILSIFCLVVLIKSWRQEDKQDKLKKEIDLVDGIISSHLEDHGYAKEGEGE